MPGIAGILTKQNHRHASQLLQAMLQSMMHEPFYKSVSHTDQEHGWFAGNVAISETFADGGPHFNETQSVALLMAGECFNETPRTTGSRSKGHQLKSGNPAYIVHLYEEEGLNFISVLNGLFSGVLLDSDTGRAILFTDRYGLRRIYYHEASDGLYFASEAKAVLGVVPSLRTIEPQSMAEYLCFDCVLEGRSYFPHVNILPGGTFLIYDNGCVEKRSYYDPKEFEGLPPVEPRSFFDRLRMTFQKAVVQQIGNDDEISIALTGGLDTRLIMACLPCNYRHVTTFTFGGMYRDSMDVRLAREVSKACQLPHSTVRLDKEFLADYGTQAARAVYLTDGLADATNVDIIFLNKHVRNFTSTKLTGAFGSQLLGKVKRGLRYRPPTPELLSGDFKPYVAATSERLDAWRNEHNLSYCLKREIPWYWQRFIAGEMSQLTVRLPFLDNDFIDLLYRAPRGGFDGSKFELDAISKMKPELLNVRTNLGAGGRSPAIVSSILQKLIIARALVDKSFNWDVLPYSLQHVATRVDSLLLSPMRLDRLFRGWEFFRHYNQWFRRELSSDLKEIVLDQETLKRPYWNPKYLETMVHDHVSGRRNNLADIRKVLTIELIFRELLGQRWSGLPRIQISQVGSGRS